MDVQVTKEKVVEALIAANAPTERHERVKRLGTDAIQPIPVDARLVGIGVYAGEERFPRPFGTIVRSVTGSWICHVGMLFQFVHNGHAYPVVYEARPNGFLGPITFDYTFHRWVRAFRDFGVRWLPRVPVESIHAKFLIAEAWVKQRHGYDWQALIEIWLRARLGLKLPERCPCQLICSEAVGRLLAPEYEVRDDENPTYDTLTPGRLWRNLNVRLSASR